MVKRYKIEGRLSVEGHGDDRFADLSGTELRRCCRTIGGDLGDVEFQGYTNDTDEDGNPICVLFKPVLATTFADLIADEVFNIANDIVRASYDSIGLETVYG